LYSSPEAFFLQADLQRQNGLEWHEVLLADHGSDSVIWGVSGIDRAHILSGNRFDDVIASPRIVYLHTTNPRRMKIAEQDHELFAAAELPPLVSDAWWSNCRFRK
jgi:hypothetical protein